MIPLIEKEVVERRRWIEREEFTEMLTLAQSAPGPISINSAVFVGYKTLGLGGMITAVLGTGCHVLYRHPRKPHGGTHLSWHPASSRLADCRACCQHAEEKRFQSLRRLISHDCSAGCLVVWRFARLGYCGSRRDRCHLPFLDRERAPREIKWTK